MNDQYHSILGLPGSGKTTYLAALWHVLDAGEVQTKLILDKLVGDNEYLNKIVEAWRRCEEVPRTSMQDEKQIVIHTHVPASGTKVALRFPDLSGESFKQQFATRTCTPDYVQGFSDVGGILLFVNANRPSDGMTLADIQPVLTEPNEQGETPAGRDWTPDVVPEQVRLVDLVQFLLRAPFERRLRRLVVIVSAWDVVMEPKPSPEEWLKRELPLLYQFLLNNPESFDVRVYGVSAQGGDVTGEQRAALLQQTPSHRIECAGPEADAYDITAPLLWLTGDHEVGG
jgi:hypothetical protein